MVNSYKFHSVSSINFPLFVLSSLLILVYFFMHAVSHMVYAVSPDGDTYTYIHSFKLNFS